MNNRIAENILNYNIHKIPGQSEENVKKIAVLFTDIVGSTQYFKTHGDQAGRMMLGRHHEIASRIIHEFQGRVVKNIGDSVMAYFMDPKDALKSAINIQQKYSEYNRLKNESDNIHIRISIHFGYGIIEENDIYGDVVNVTSKITSVTEGNQIYISQEVYNVTRDLQAMQFELIDVSKRKNIPDGLILYRVVWKETVIFEPIVTVVLIIKPLWEMVGDGFKTAWHDLFDRKNDLWQTHVEKGTILSDMTIVLSLKNDNVVLDVAYNVIKHLRDKSREESETSCIPAYIVINSGNYLRADKIDTQDLHVPWEKMEAGDIYISYSAYDLLKQKCENLPDIIKDAKDSRSFFKLNVINSGQEEKKSYIFHHHAALIHGENPSCYYCGSRKHPINTCPSKNLPEITNAISEIGYKSIDEVNRLYSDYLKRSNFEFNETNDDNSNLMTAHQAFYDLKRIFQLRFFRMIWNTGNKTWNDVKGRVCEGNRSGITWIAQDCIRVSDLRKAESLLEDSMIGNPDDYKVYCATGFLNIERRNYPLAEQFFDKALTCAKTEGEKIFLHFLLFRIYELNNNLSKAASKLNEILIIDPQCSDALYLDIVLQFRQGGTTEPLRRLLNLIQNDRDYYVYAMLDPDLQSFMNIIKPQLDELLKNVKGDAEKVLRESEGELRKLTGIFCHDEKTLLKANETWVKINKLVESNSYFGWLDIIYHGSVIIKTVQRKIGEYKNEITEGLYDLNQKVRIILKFAFNYQHKELLKPFCNKLEILQKMINDCCRNNDICTPDELMKAYKNKQLIANELALIEEKIKKLVTIQWIKYFITKFMKRNVIFISITVISAFILMPIIVFYANMILDKLSIQQIYHIWFYQKMAMIIGCILSLVLSFLITSMDVPKKDFPIS